MNLLSQSATRPRFLASLEMTERLLLLAELDEYAACGFWMQECYLHIMGAGLWGFVDELDTFGFESGKLADHVVGLDSKMVDAFASFGDELRDRRIVTSRFGQFDDSITDLEGSNADALILDDLMMHLVSPEQLPEQVFGDRQVLHRNTDMRYPLHESLRKSKVKIKKSKTKS